jgi:hypothetical protein
MMAAVIGEPKRACGYRRQGMLDGVSYIAESYAMRLVLENKIEEVLQKHREGRESVTTVLEYSAKRGRHKMTQALVAAGVTVTQAAIQAAAKLGGPGVDLLLGGVRDGEAREMALHDALYARIYYGEFDRAAEMLEQGVTPSELCYRGLDVGSKRDRQRADERRQRVQTLMDLMIPMTPVDQFTTDTVQAILSSGRPVHIERALEVIKRTPSFLLLPAIEMKAAEAIESLRHLGMRVDDPTFQWVSGELLKIPYLARWRVCAVIQEYVKDSGQTMRVQTIEPLLMAALNEQEYYLRKISGPDAESYRMASDVLLPFVNCMDPTEHLNLLDSIDRWAARAGINVRIPPAVTAVMKHTIQTAHSLAEEQMMNCEAPTR